MTLVLAGCHLGDPAGSSAGVVSVDGRVAVVVPPCGDEYVQELSVEEDGVDAGGAPRPTSRQLWHVVGMPRDRRGPFVIGDATGWTSERVPLTEPLPAIFVVSVTTTRRIAASGVSASAVAGLADGQVLIDSNVSSLAALSEQWEC
ncbi:hypothetical protein AB0J74_18070 [Asanoa sp. NPDC049573]|uniref:hypothetical protein n=1 Tax=Asanoa sp. NPDC049573 TaxID=3155396 RepID=UPI00341C9ED0